MITIPETIIKDVLELQLKRVYDDLLEKEAIGDVIDAVDIDSGVTINVTQQGSVGTSEITDVAFVADNNGSLAGKYWYINTPSIRYMVWYKVNGVGTKPNVTDRYPLLINLDTDETAINVAKKTRLRLLRTGDYTMDEPTTDTMTINTRYTYAKKSTILYKIFGNRTFDDMEYFTQAASIIKDRYGNEKRKLGIYQGYNPNRQNFPVVSIMLPNEENQPKNIGTKQGIKNNYDGTKSEMYEGDFTTTYNLLVNSDNVNEVVIIYHLLKTILMLSVNEFELRCFVNMSVSGRDVTMDFDIQPIYTYHRTIALSFTYFNKISGFESGENITDVEFTGTIIS